MSLEGSSDEINREEIPLHVGHTSVLQAVVVPFLAVPAVPETVRVILQPGLTNLVSLRVIFRLRRVRDEI